MNRSRFWYFAGICLIVALGLASRRYASSLPVFLARYAGDTLWAMVMFGVVGLLAAEWSSFRVAVATLMQSYAIEGSQLSHASWLDAVRQTRFCGLVLGYGFLWSDIVCYTIGVGCGWIAEQCATGVPTHTSSPDMTPTDQGERAQSNL